MPESVSFQINLSGSDVKSIVIKRWHRCNHCTHLLSFNPRRKEILIGLVANTGNYALLRQKVPAHVCIIGISELEYILVSRQSTTNLTF
jgi:hypothetical protein